MRGVVGRLKRRSHIQHFVMLWFGIIPSLWSIVVCGWNHFALVRNGGNLTVYMNGTSTGTRGDLGTSSANYNTNMVLYIGCNYGVAFPMTGYLDELRVTKGVARYTSSFTSPTAPFPTS